MGSHLGNILIFVPKEEVVSPAVSVAYHAQRFARLDQFHHGFKKSLLAAKFLEPVQILVLRVCTLELLVHHGYGILDGFVVVVSVVIVVFGDEEH